VRGKVQISTGEDAGTIGMSVDSMESARQHVSYGNAPKTEAVEQLVSATGLSYERVVDVVMIQATCEDPRECEKWRVLLAQDDEWAEAMKMESGLAVTLSVATGVNAPGLTVRDTAKAGLPSAGRDTIAEILDGHTMANRPGDRWAPYRLVTGSVNTVAVPCSVAIACDHAAKDDIDARGVPRIWRVQGGEGRWAGSHREVGVEHRETRHCLSCKPRLNVGQDIAQRRTASASGLGFE